MPMSTRALAGEDEESCEQRAGEGRLGEVLELGADGVFGQLLGLLLRRGHGWPSVHGWPSFSVELLLFVTVFFRTSV